MESAADPARRPNVFRTGPTRIASLDSTRPTPVSRLAVPAVIPLAIRDTTRPVVPHIMRGGIKGSRNLGGPVAAVGDAPDWMSAWYRMPFRHETPYVVSADSPRHNSPVEWAVQGPLPRLRLPIQHEIRRNVQLPVLQVEQLAEQRREQLSVQLLKQLLELLAVQLREQLRIQVKVNLKT